VIRSMNSSIKPEAAKPAASPASVARRVMRSADRATFATAQRDAGGWPYPSLVLTALDNDASPLLLISDLADHTANIKADPRAGLLFDGTGGLTEPLTGPRVSVLGRMEVTDDPRHRARFLARHESAGLYAGFGDFTVWRMVVERAHLVAGFGRIHWIEGDDLLLRLPDIETLALREADVVEHMNEDHADAVEQYATVLLGQTGGGWKMTGIDPEGCDLRLGGRTARLDFDDPVLDAEAARVELVKLVRRARASQGETQT
jgi:putative heme iron utilization protein